VGVLHGAAIMNCSNSAVFFNSLHYSLRIREITCLVS
jgi:hypothetical protein